MRRDTSNQGMRMQVPQVPFVRVGANDMGLTPLRFLFARPWLSPGHFRSRTFTCD